MDQTAYQSEIANPVNMKFIKYSKILNQEDPNYNNDMLEEMNKHRVFSIYLLMDYNDQSNQSKNNKFKLNQDDSEQIEEKVPHS